MTLVNASPRSLGTAQVGPIGFGCWRFTDPDIAAGQALIESALELGMNLIDTADVYGLDWGGTGFGRNEEILGEVLAASPGLRDRMVLATKGGIAPPTPYDSSPEAITAACEASLRRLQVDRVDLYQIHRPDMYTHPEALAGALDALRTAGKIAEVGVSNHTPAQVDALQRHLPFPIVSDQPQFSLTHLDPLRDGTLDRAMRESVTPLAWSPLGGGALATGEGVDADLLTVIDGIAEREKVSRAVVAVAFVLAHPSAPVAIIGSQKSSRLQELAAATTVTLDRADVYGLIQASDGVPLP